jgi:hypothetical protein
VSTGTVIGCEQIALAGLRASDPYAERDIRACYVIDHAVDNNIIVAQIQRAY